jgi:hypothetical protein
LQQHEEDGTSSLASDDFGPARRGAFEPPPVSPNERGRATPFAQMAIHAECSADFDDDPG